MCALNGRKMIVAISTATVTVIIILSFFIFKYRLSLIENSLQNVSFNYSSLHKNVNQTVGLQNDGKLEGEQKIMAQETKKVAYSMCDEEVRDFFINYNNYLVYETDGVIMNDSIVQINGINVVMDKVDGIWINIYSISEDALSIDSGKCYTWKIKLMIDASIISEKELTNTLSSNAIRIEYTYNWGIFKDNHMKMIGTLIR